MTIGIAVLIFLDLVANNLEPVALAAGSDDLFKMMKEFKKCGKILL
ncbi:MAG: hypothetical protein IJ725_04005 [Ruminococcus sp.]|nr:hypothetical protein [Alphaproteobacteria bacterium]MBQ8693375.1 hypothetical protein [Synergistaceae bacterium]MBR1602887.1 hypothetical protein [Synergistaceae bacterium]MBR1731575.1 hypothetical protein [Ruminococcus sp.]